MNNTLNYLTFSLLLSLTVLLPFAGNGQCSIDNLIAEASQCDTNLLFYMDISLEVENPDSDSFYVELEGQLFGPFSYADVPVSVGPFYGNGEDSWITVYDMINHACSARTMIEKPDCAWVKCGIENLTIVSMECIPHLNAVSICVDFDIVGSSIEEVSAFYGSIYLGDYIVDELPLCSLLIPYDIDFSEGVFTLCAGDYQSCCDDLIFAMPDCNSDCFISDFIIENHDCDSVGNFYVDIDFKVHNTMTDSFDIHIKDAEGAVYYEGSHSYSELPLIHIGPFAGTGEDFNYAVAARGYESCSYETTHATPHCTECAIKVLFAEANPCDTNMMFYFDVTLEVENPASDSFFVEMEGRVFGPFAYTDVPVKVGPFNGNGEDTWIYVEDINDPGCFEQINVLKPNCHQEECAIENLRIISLECIPGLNAVSICVDFDIIGTTVDEISAFYGAVHIGDYKIDELPFCNILIPYDIGISEGTFSICAGDYQACCDDVIFTMPDCNSDCFISDFIIENHDCDSMGNFYVDIDFKVHNTMTDSFDIYITDSDGALSYEGSHPYSELPLSHIGPFNGTGEDFNYAVTARGYESCSYQTSHGSPKCITSIVESELPELKVKDLGYAWLIEANQSIRKYDLYNIQGLIMDSGSLNFNDLTIDKAQLSPGIYFLNLKFDESPVRLKLINY